MTTYLWDKTIELLCPKGRMLTVWARWKVTRPFEFESVAARGALESPRLRHLTCMVLQGSLFAMKLLQPFRYGLGSLIEKLASSVAPDFKQVRRLF